MATADPFNSVSGYTVNIPPISVIDANGNITSNKATISNLTVTGNAAVSGTISATNFFGNVQGNITANISITGQNKGMLFNNNGLAAAADTVTYDTDAQSLVIDNTLYANNFALGLGNNQFYNISSFVATTSTTAPNQVLHRIPAETICGLEYTIIATDAVANTRQISKLNAIVLGREVGYTEFGTADAPVTNTSGVADFRVSFETGGIYGNVILTTTPVAAHQTDYKILVTSYKA